MRAEISAVLLAEDGVRAATLAATLAGAADAVRADASPGAVASTAVVHRCADTGVTVAFDAAFDRLDGLAVQLGLERDAEVGAVLAAGWHRHGVDLPRRLLGDYAFVLVDPRAAKLFGARDPMGVRSLYHRTVPGGVAVASRLRALADVATRRVSVDALAALLLDEYGELDETLFEDVRALPPGARLVADAHGITVDRHWKPSFARTSTTLDDAAKELHQTLAAAVEDAVARHARVGLFVSGGLDSPSLASLLRGRRNVQLYTLTFPGLPCDELDLSREVARHLSLPLRAIEPDPLGRWLDPEVCAAEAPDLYYTVHANFDGTLLDAARADGVTLVLTGVGADQLMPRLRFEDCVDDLRALRPWRLLRDSRNPWLPSRRRQLRLLASAMRVALQYPNPADLPIVYARGRIKARRWLRPGVGERAIAFARRSEPPHDDRSFVAAAERYWLHGPHLSLPLVRVDRKSRRAGVEMRQPYLDLRVVELMHRLPPGLRRGWGDQPRKPLLRRAFAGDLPQRIGAREDRALFDPFVERVLGGVHRRLVEDTLNARSRLAQLDLIDVAGIIRLVREDASEAATPFAAELWLRTLE